MSQIFPRSANTIARISVIGLILAIPAVCGIWVMVNQSPYVTGVGHFEEQPIAFSHVVHVRDLELDCRYCHVSVEVSPFAGMPTTETCMTCHSQVATGLVPVAAVRSSYESGIPIAWRRVTGLPDYTYFDHSVHVFRGIECETCHGDVAQMSVVWQAKPLTMHWCLECHRDMQPVRTFAYEEGTTTLGEEQVLALHESLVEGELIDERLDDCYVCHR